MVKNGKTPASRRAHAALLQTKVADWQAATREGWPLPEVDYARSTMTFYGNSRKFRVVLSWGPNGWEVCTRGLHTDLDRFGRTVAVLRLAGLDDRTLIRLGGLCGQRDPLMAYRQAWQRIWQLAAEGDALCLRATREPLLV